MRVGSSNGGSNQGGEWGWGYEVACVGLCMLGLRLETLGLDLLFTGYPPNPPTLTPEPQP